MQHRLCNIIIFWLISASTLLYGETNLLLRRHYALSAENQKIIPIVNLACADLYKQLAKQPEFNITHIDSVQHFLRSPFLKTFTRDVPLHTLLDIQNQFHIDYFIYFELQQRNGFKLIMQIVEFPSDVAVLSFSIPINAKSDSKAVAAELLQALKIPPAPVYGFPFAQETTGFIYITSPQHPSFEKDIAVLEKWKKMAGNALTIKVIQKDNKRPKDAQLYHQVQADAVLSINADSAWVWQKLDSMPKQLLDTDLPIWPAPVFQFSKIEIEPDFLDLLLTAYFPDKQLLRSQQLYTTLAAQNAAPISLAALFKLAPVLESANETRRYNLKNHFKQLFSCYFEEPEKSGWLSLNSGGFSQKIHQPDIALTNYKSAELAFMSSKNLQGQLLAILKQAKIYTAMRDIRSAINAFLKAEKLAVQENEQLASAQIQEQLGHLYKSIHQPLDAWLVWENAAQTFAALDLKTNAIPVYYNLAILLDDEQYGTHAEQFYLKGLDLAVQLDDITSQATFRKSMGYFYKSRRETQKAVQYFIQAIDDLEMLGKFDAIAEIDRELGALYVTLNKFSKAQQHFLHSLHFYQTAKNDSTSMDILINTGDVLTHLKKWKRAEWNFQRALYYAEKLQADQTIVSIYYKMGLAQLKSGDYDNGLKSIKLARMLGQGQTLPLPKNGTLRREIQELLQKEQQ